eukprot:3768880-Amphidinium_carterae.1
MFLYLGLGNSDAQWRMLRNTPSQSFSMGTTCPPNGTAPADHGTPSLSQHAPPHVFEYGLKSQLTGARQPTFMASVLAQDVLSPKTYQ